MRGLFPSGLVFLNSEVGKVVIGVGSANGTRWHLGLFPKLIAGQPDAHDEICREVIYLDGKEIPARFRFTRHHRWRDLPHSLRWPAKLRETGRSPPKQIFLPTKGGRNITGSP